MNWVKKMFARWFSKKETARKTEPSKNMTASRASSQDYSGSYDQSATGIDPWTQQMLLQNVIFDQETHRAQETHAHQPHQDHGSNNTHHSSHDHHASSDSHQSHDTHSVSPSVETTHHSSYDHSSLDSSSSYDSGSGGFDSGGHHSQ